MYGAGGARKGSNIVKQNGRRACAHQRVWAYQYQAAEASIKQAKMMAQRNGEGESVVCE